MKISEYGVKHPVVVGMLLIVLVVFGVVSIASMNIEFMADVSAPSVMVVAVYPGASAEDMEQEVTSVLEDDFVTLPDFKGVESQSSNSVSFVTITFRDGIDPHDRISEVRDRINKLMEQLPDGLSGIPDVFVGGVEMLPVFSFSVGAGKDVGTVTTYVQETLRPKLTAISGVSNVEVSGGKKLRVDVKLRLDDMSAKSVSALAVYQALNYSNVSLPAGNSIYNQKNISVRYSGEISSLEDLRQLPVGGSEDGIIIRLQDVADVTLSYPQADVHVTDGKEPLVLVEVLKRSDGNTVKIARQVKSILAASEKETGGALSYNIVSDDSRTILASLRTVVMSGVMGILMAIFVIFLFLNDVRATMIIGISIPLSILFTFVAMKVFGITINLMSLSGIVVALGMVVDGSIVMIEQVFRHYSQKDGQGKSLHSVDKAISIGADEVGSSIFASTATTVVVFIPIAMLSGIVGMILRDVALTLIMALVASLVSALVVVPFLLHVLLKPENHRQKKVSIVDRGMAKLEEKYRSMLEWALASWKFVVFLAVLVFAASLFITTTLGVSFIPSTDNSDFYIDVDFPSGYTLEQTQSRIEQIGKLLKTHVPEVQNAVFFSGASQSFGSSGNVPNSGYAHVVLVPVAERKRDVHEIILLMQQLITQNIPDVTVKVSNGGFDKLLGYVSGGGGYGLTLASEDMEALYETSSSLADFLRKDPDVVSVEMDTTFDTETLTIDMVHDYMSSLGVTSYEAGITAAILFQGMEAGRFTDWQDGGTRYDIRIFSDITGKEITEDVFGDIQVVSSVGVLVSFSSMADLVPKNAVSQINHTDRAKTITVSATLVDEDTAGVSRRVNQWLSENPLPSGISSQAGGIMELIGDSLPSLLTALCIAFFLVYTVMVLQFEQFRQPLVVMATIPFCLVGVVLGLLLFGSTMSLLALMGVISLGGIVVNNGIILVDYINLLRKQENTEETEEKLKDCVVAGSASRLRPIFMTTLTTMLGVIPLAMSRGEGAEIYAPLGQAIAGGLLTSTLITLFVIPVLYFASENKKIKRRKGGANKAKVLSLLVTVLFSVPGTYGTDFYTKERLSDIMDLNNADILKAKEEYERSLLDLKDAKAGLQPTVDLSLGASYMVNPLIGKIQAEEGTLGTLPVQNPFTGEFFMQPLPAQDLVIFDGMPNALYSLKLDMQQPIFTWGKISNAVKIYSSNVEIRRMQLSAQRKQLDCQLEASLCALYFLSEMQELLDMQKEYANRLVELSVQAEQRGALLRQNVLEAKMQEALVPLTQEDVKSRKDNLLQSLRKITGISNLAQEKISFVPPLEEYKALSAIAQLDLENAALGSSQESLAILDELYRIAVLNQKIAEGSVYWKPDLALQVSVGLSGDMEKLFKGKTKFSRDLVADFTLGIKTTIWDGGKKLNQIRRAESELSTVVLNRKDAEDSILQELRSQLSVLNMAMLRIEYQELKIQVAQSDVENSEKLASSGYGSERDVLAKKIDLVTEKIALLQEKINLSNAACSIYALIR